MKTLKSIILAILISSVTSAQNFSVYGYIRDKVSAEFLPEATVWISTQTKGTSANSYGYFSLDLSAGEHTLNVSFVGYRPFSTTINLSTDTLINIDLEPQTITLKDVTIQGNSNRIFQTPETGSHSLRMSHINEMPVAIGEPDIVKSLQLLPGIQVSNEGSTNLSVRGGSYDQNLFLVDDAPIYNPSHALGFFSVFNTDAIKSVKLYKSYFPSQYGGRLSSIVDVRLKEGNKKRATGQGRIGLIASSLTIESPIIENKSSFMLSGRYSYAGSVVNALGNLGQLAGMSGLRNFRDKNEISFYDFNVKLNFTLNKKNRLFLSGYAGHDHFFYYALDNNSTMDWGNYAGTIRWNKLFSTRLFCNTTALFSKYSYSYIINQSVRNFEWSANMQELDFKSDFDFFINSENHLKFGICLETHAYKPGRIQPLNDDSAIKAAELDQQNSVIADAYIHNNQKIGQRIALSYGMRYSSFSLLGEEMVYSYSPDMAVLDSTYYSKGELVQFYHSFEPRIALRYSLSKNSSLKASYSRVTQYQHLLTNSSVGLPTDIWLPSTPHLSPQSVNQTSLGFYYEQPYGFIDFSIEGYYRKMKNVIDFRDNADIFLNTNIETQVLSGTGKAYGAEFMLMKNTGSLTGQMSYTISRTTREIPGINNGKAYSPTFDKRHNFVLSGRYQFSPRWCIASVLKYTSGGFATIPEGMYYFKGATFNYFTERNGYQLPAYHRLDISFHFKNKNTPKRRIMTEWNVGIYNVYHRKNVFALFVKQDDMALSKSMAQKMYLYGITPYVSLHFKF